MILPFLFFLVKMHPQMFLLPIVHRTHRMSVRHLIMERTNISFWIHWICHLFFLEIQGVKNSVSHQPLYMIRQVMRMQMYIFIFLIVVVMISSLVHSNMMLIHLFFIFLSHRSLMKHMLAKWKPLKLSRHFFLANEALAALRMITLLIINLLKHPRLLITLLFALKVNLIYIFHILD